ncbi:ankyrin repeat domain-containing protein [Endozoicomonas sp. SCSIO W0465]|uniref:ankyrin repeat domain-containing protein n=1 Tax=Endozoicomonas sp. SCSIO W0465 TaxID=2918516 RepID=UPI002074F309|nr:ankyrin repeat domain-containing protein [Endozoicomonas sp. SCSIO W0465]USE37677.1 ankyrin repeat domain-containing protein [Endozoicomonas sp. SCSIO W0465]
MLNSYSAEYHPDKPRGDGITAMSMAIQKGHTETTKILLEHNADPNYKIRYATVDGQCRDIGSFGEQEPIPSSQLWYTPVMLAVRHGNLIILEQLLSKGGNPNNIDPANPLQQSPLQQALNYPQDSSAESAAKIVELLLEHAADMHEKLVPADAAISNKTGFYPQLLTYCRQFLGWLGYTVNSGGDAQNSPFCLPSTSTHLLPTLFEIACFFAEMRLRTESDRIAATFCDYYRRAPEGKPVEPSLLKWFYAGQCFLKGPGLHSYCSDFIRKDSILKLHFISNVSKLHTLSSVFGQEDPSDCPRDKADRALDYDRELQSELMKDIDKADTAMLHEMAVTALEKFNKYTMNFNDEAVINYPQKKT